MRAQQDVVNKIVRKKFSGGASSIGMAVAGPMKGLSQDKIEKLKHQWTDKQRDKKVIREKEE